MLDAVRFQERIAARFRSIRIVPYDPAYLESGLEVARGIHAHSIYRTLPLDETKLIRQLGSSGTEFAPDRYFRLAVRAGSVLGGFYGCVMRAFFCDELLAKDMGWWVRPEARGSAAAVLLLIDFERWAIERGARVCTIGQSGIENIERTGKLFMHCGYQFTGYNAAKVLSHDKVLAHDKALHG